MDWSARKQLMIIGSIFLVVAFLVVGLVWLVFLNENPTCFDGEMNGDETGVDCGGSCQLVCRQEARSLSVLWQDSVGHGDGTYRLAAYVENTNPASAIFDLRYRFRVFDRNNVFVDEYVGSTSIAPAARTLILVPDVILEEEPSRVFFEIDPAFEWLTTPERFSGSVITVDQVVYDEESFVPKLTARVKNTSTIDIHDVNFMALLYDSFDNVVAYSQTGLAKIEHGRTADLVFTWTDFFDEDILRVEVVPQINVFHDKNYRITR